MGLSCNTQGLRCIIRDFFISAHNSLVAACGFSCSKACGILVPWPGIEPESPALQGGFSTLDHQGSPSNTLPLSLLQILTQDLHSLLHFWILFQHLPLLEPPGASCLGPSFQMHWPLFSPAQPDLRTELTPQPSLSLQNIHSAIITPLLTFPGSSSSPSPSIRSSLGSDLSPCPSSLYTLL